MTFDEFWHAQPFGWAACDAMTLARKVWDHQQAEIDELMLEFCPDQMTAEQLGEYERHQVVVAPNVELWGERSESHTNAVLGTVANGGADGTG